MKNILRQIDLYGLKLLLFFLSTLAHSLTYADDSDTDTCNADGCIEVRSMLSMKLPHPFEGPKSFTEEVMSGLLHSPVNDYVKENGCDLGFEEKVIEGGQSLWRPTLEPINYNLDCDTKSIAKGINETLRQLSWYQHPFSVTINSVNSEGDFESLEIAHRSKKGFQYLPVMNKKWGESILRYERTIPEVSTGKYRFREYSATSSNKNERRNTSGEYIFQAEDLSGRRNLHLLTFRGLPKTELIERLRSEESEVSVYFDVPFRRMLRKGEEEAKVWGVTPLPTRTLKLMCPNYNNPKVYSLFGDDDHGHSLRTILQSQVDLIHKDPKTRVGVKESGLRMVNSKNIFRKSDQRRSTRYNYEKNQINRNWKRWKNNVQVSQQEDGVGDWFKVVTVDTGENRLTSGKKKGIFNFGSELPPVVMEVHAADSINDEFFMDNLMERLESSDFPQLNLDRANNHIGTDQMNRLLYGDVDLGEHEWVLFDLLLEHGQQGRQIARQFIDQGSFFGLTESVAPNTVQLAKKLASGTERKGDKDRFGVALRQELPCLLVGEHPFFAYERKVGFSRLTPLRELDNQQAKSSPDGAYQYAERIKGTAQQDDSF